MEKLTEFIITAFAVWRIGSIIAREDAPFNLMVKFRTWISEQESPLLMTLSDGIHCVWCNTVWLGLFASMLISDNVIEFVIYTFALSGMALVIEKVAYG